VLPEPDASPVRAVAWRRLDTAGAEYCTLATSTEGWLLGGTVIAALEGRPIQADYLVITDGTWATREVHVTVHGETTPRSLWLRVGPEARWRPAWKREQPDIPTVTGCSDVDLAITPATNVLPIRRLDLDVGQSAEVQAAWIRFPGLDMERLDQRYTRLAPDRYLYESASGFSRELEVDDLGLVVTYPGFWERVATLDTQGA
jgi:uncharacterized protein